jgi:hypothetical protein
MRAIAKLATFRKNEINLQYEKAAHAGGFQFWPKRRNGAQYLRTSGNVPSTTLGSSQR